MGFLPARFRRYVSGMYLLAFVSDSDVIVSGTNVNELCGSVLLKWHDHVSHRNSVELYEYKLPTSTKYSFQITCSSTEMAQNFSKLAAQETGISKGYTHRSGLEECLLAALRRFIRGAITGFSLYTLVILLKGLIAKKLLQRPGDVIRDIVCIDALRFTLFLGSYPALYKLALYLVQIYRKQKDGISYIIAAVIASLSAIIDKADRRKRLAMFLFTRALGAAYNALACRGKMPSVPQGTSLVFSASIGVIIVAFVREPQLLSKEYYEGVKTWTRDYTEDILVNYYRKPYGRFVSCDEFLHPGKSCLGHAFHELFASWFTFSKIYLPIHLIPLLLSRQKVIISSPVPSLLSLFMKYVKSATFLTVMCTTIKVVVCLLRQNVHHSPAPVPRYLMFIAGFIGALIGVQFESRSRRGELAMYVASTALDAVFIWGRDAGLFKSLPCGSLLIFIISMAAITHAYERDRDSLSPMVKGGMTFLCGKPENQKVINGDEIPAGKSTQHIDAGNVS